MLYLKKATRREKLFEAINEFNKNYEACTNLIDEVTSLLQQLEKVEEKKPFYYSIFIVIGAILLMLVSYFIYKRIRKEK
jgi:hypothetical protein